MLRMIFLVVLLVSSVSLAKADSFVITNGSFTFSGLAIDFHTSSSFSGSGFSAQLATHSVGGGFVPALICPFNTYCVPGSSISLIANTGGLGATDINGTFTINGQSFGFVVPFGNAGFAFTAGDVVIPFGNAPMITLSTPFSMVGDVRGGTFQNPASAHLTGNGTAYLFLVLDSRPFPDGLHYGVDRITYQFGPAPVPEPATLLLLSAGLGAVGILRRRLKIKKDD